MAAISIPASDGPISRAMFTIDELMAMALPRSARSSTICTMNDCRPGMSKALMMPCMTLSARIQWMVMRPEKGERGQRERLHHGQRLRPHQHLPAVRAGPPRRRQTAPAEMWESGPRSSPCPAAAPNSVSRYTSHDVAMRVIQVPMSEMVCPPKNSRKLRCRSARHACDTPGAASVFIALSLPFACISLHLPLLVPILYS